MFTLNLEKIRQFKVEDLHIEHSSMVEDLDVEHTYMVMHFG